MKKICILIYLPMIYECLWAASLSHLCQNQLTRITFIWNTFRIKNVALTVVQSIEQTCKSLTGNNRKEKGQLCTKNYFFLIYLVFFHYIVFPSLLSFLSTMFLLEPSLHKLNKRNNFNVFFPNYKNQEKNNFLISHYLVQMTWQFMLHTSTYLHFFLFI